MADTTETGIPPLHSDAWKEVFAKVLNCDKGVVNINVWHGMLQIGTMGSVQFVTFWQGRKSLEALANLIANRNNNRQAERIDEIQRDYHTTVNAQIKFLHRLEADKAEAQRLMSLIPDTEMDKTP